MNFIKRMMLVLSSVLLFNALSTAQVTIGSGHDPAQGAILDIKQDKVSSGPDSRKGLLLPRVQLESEDQILETANGENAAHIGLMVYSVGNPDCPFFRKGVYVWDGQIWNLINKNGKAYKDTDKVGIYVEGKDLENNDLDVTQDFSGTELLLRQNQKYILKGRVDEENISYQWSFNDGEPISSSNGEYVINKLTEEDEGTYTCIMTDACGASIERSIDITIGGIDCTPYEVGMAVNYVTSGSGLTPSAGGQYMIDRGRTIYFIATINQPDASISNITWTSPTSGATLPVSTGNKISQLKDGISEGDKVVVYNWYAELDNGCTSEGTITLQTFDPNCILETFIPIHGSIYSVDEKNEFLWVVRQGTVNATLNSPAPVDEWGGSTTYKHNKTITASTNDVINVTIGTCKGKITIIALGGTTSGCQSVEGTDPIVASGIFTEDRNGNLIEQDFPLDLKASTLLPLHAQVRTGSPWISAANNDYIVFWYTSPIGSSTNYKFYEEGPTISINKKNIDWEGNKLTMQVIQKKTGCTRSSGGNMSR